MQSLDDHFLDKLPMPWMSPKVSPALTVVVRNLGHKVVCRPKEVVYQSGGLFDRLMYVQSGIAARAVFIPGFDNSPFLVSIAMPGSLIGGIETLYAKDTIQRKHWAVTDCELLTVSQDLLLKLADHQVIWHKELAGYNAACTQYDQLGLMTARATEAENRLGVFLVSFCLRCKALFSSELSDEKKEWVVLPTLPPKELIGSTIGCTEEIVNDVMSRWLESNILRKVNRNLLIRREKVLNYIDWISKF